ncbi:ABC transporter permease [Actinotalea sp. K2]|uniref:ABC transporter permease n=1 Tax=Actinotalea sp. K2 TaxID=2939438 RepID=UPI00201820BE|nr:ABC transporter permease subunit [Actinotalea sp. K2]MCL3859656.1 ABC transporter permease subunit [Actinotalea sp. K2]
MTSTTAAEAARRDARWRAARPVLAVVFWVGCWQVAATALDQQILLVPPGEVVVRLVELGGTADFWATVWHSFARIVSGFGAATIVGVLLAALAATSRVVDALVTPLATAIRTTPVVSFIILVLMWSGSGRLAFLISFMMVAPIIYTNVLEGIHRRDRALLEVAEVFGIPLVRRIPAIDVPAVLPYLVAGCRVGVGLAWKSGIAAEVIGLPQGSIGERLYQAKIFLSTADVFAWTLVVIALSFAVEKAVLVLLGRSQRSPSRVGSR